MEKDRIDAIQIIDKAIYEMLIEKAPLSKEVYNAANMLTDSRIYLRGGQPTNLFSRLFFLGSFSLTSKRLVV